MHLKFYPYDLTTKLRTRLILSIWQTGNGQKIVVKHPYQPILCFISGVDQEALVQLTDFAVDTAKVTHCKQ